MRLTAEPLESRDTPAPMAAAAFPGVAERFGFLDPHDAYISPTPDGSVVFQAVAGGTGDGPRLVLLPWVGGKELPTDAAGAVTSVYLDAPAGRTGFEIESVTLPDRTTALTVAALDGGAARLQVIGFHPDGTVKSHLSFYAAEEEYRRGIDYLSATDADGDGDGDVVVILGGPVGPTVMRAYDPLTGDQTASLYLGAEAGWLPVPACLGRFTAADGAVVFLVERGGSPGAAGVTKEVVWATGEVRDPVDGPAARASVVAPAGGGFDEVAVGGPLVG